MTNAHAASSETIRLGSHQVRVRIHGEGPPLLLLNGLGAPLELWEPLTRRLEGFRTIALDAPGSGGSKPPALPLSIRGHARLALQLLDELTEPRVHVLGFSMGGMVAQELTHLDEARVDRLVLASTSCGWASVPGNPAALLAVSTPARYYSRRLFESVAPSYAGGRESVDPGFLRRQGEDRQQHPPSLSGYAYQLWAAATWSSAPWLGGIRRPTLVVSGDADPLVPPGNAQILAGLIAGAQTHLVRGGGHLCVLERAEEVAPVVAGFLGGAPR